VRRRSAGVPGGKCDDPSRGEQEEREWKELLVVPREVCVIRTQDVLKEHVRGISADSEGERGPGHMVAKNEYRREQGKGCHEDQRYGVEADRLVA
jgi:hypothetical protein